MLEVALQALPQDTLAQACWCESNRCIMLASTSKKMRRIVGCLLRPRVAIKYSIQEDLDEVEFFSFLDDIMPKLESWCTVVKIDLCDAYFDEEDISILTDAMCLGYCESLENLRLNAESLLGNNHSLNSTADLAQALSLQTCPRLQVLELDGDHTRKQYFMGSEGLTALSTGLTTCSSLSMLSLGCNHIGWDRNSQPNNNGIAVFCATLQQLPLLTRLFLHKNYVGEAGATILANSLRGGHCPSLRMLDLSDNGVGNAGARSLAQVFPGAPCSSLQALNLCNNAIDDVGAEDIIDMFERSTSLTQLDLSFNRMTPLLVSFLEQAWPHADLYGLNVDNMHF
tara:strand:+ start:163 stop:1182 length:1020 start_codon:yes stop_codon:yes gene_type:complete